MSETLRKYHNFQQPDNNGKFLKTPNGFPNIFHNEEFPLHFVFDADFHDMPEELMEGQQIGTAKGCNTTQYLYWEQGMVVAKGRKNGRE